jgi:cytidylate kinase
MAVITISRELGSLGTYIARQTAQKMGCPLADKVIIERILQRVKYLQPGLDPNREDEGRERWDMNSPDMTTRLDDVIQAIAVHRDVVMLGRGSFAILAHYADVLNVRIQAPFDLRVKRIMEKQHIICSEEVETLVKESDRVRSAFIESWYGVRWDSAALFDLVLDTGKIPVDTAVSWLGALFPILKSVHEPDIPTTNDIHPDGVLFQAVEQVLGGQQIAMK